jgi:hypothetical protein
MKIAAVSAIDEYRAGVDAAQRAALEHLHGWSGKSLRTPKRAGATACPPGVTANGRGSASWRPRTT